MTCPEPTSSPEGSPASPLARRASGSPKTTRGGSGRKLPDSFATYDPDGCCWRTFQGSLLEAWETFSAIWPRAGMTRSGTAYRRLPSAPLTAATGSGLWPTPRAEERQQHNSRDNGMALSRAVRMWPTPMTINRTSDKAKFGRPTSGAQRGGPSFGLQDAVEMAARGMWPTPTASMHDADTMERQRYSGQERGRVREQTGQPHRGEGHSGALNPTWVEWLMGFPLGWTDSGPSATPSSPRSPSS
jgi:hypothetical protein